MQVLYVNTIDLIWLCEWLRKYFCFQSLKAYISNWKHYVESQAENADLLDFKVKDLKTREAGFMFSKFLAF